jgi:hypothetical protein
MKELVQFLMPLDRNRMLEAKSPDMPGSAASKEQRAQFRPLLGDIPAGGIGGGAAVAGQFRKGQQADLLQRQIKQQIDSEILVDAAVLSRGFDRGHRTLRSASPHNGRWSASGRQTQWALLRSGATAQVFGN